MLIAIIENKDKTYEYLYKINNELIPYHVDKIGFSNSNVDYLNDLFLRFKYNSNCKYLTYFKEYEVYYDKEMDLKHFLLNGKEDYEMLFKYNGIDAFLYVEKEKKINMIKKFACFGMCLTIALSGIQFLESINFNIKTDPGVYMAHSISDVMGLYSDEPINYLDAIDAIKSSNLPNDVKSVISDESFLKLVFSYYKGSALEYTARLKFENLSLEPFEEGHRFENNETVNGYYSPLNSNVLRSRSADELYIQVIVHEFIHLLQAENYKYTYLVEASAELIASELLNMTPSTYLPAVENLKLLINIIGPEPIYELIFAGDDTNLINILKNNLSIQDYTKITQYLKKDGFAINNEMDFQLEIQQTLYKLYEKLYGKNINEDKNILCGITDLKQDIGYVKDERRFFIFDKTEEEISVICDEPENLSKLGIIEKKVHYKKLTKLENSTLDEIINSNNIELKENYNDEEYIQGKIFFDWNKGFYIHLENPIKKDEYKAESFINLPSKRYNIEDAINEGYITAYKVYYSNIKTDDIKEECYYYVPKDDKTTLKDSCWIFKVNGVKERFSDQYNNIIERISEESYHK